MQYIKKQMLRIEEIIKEQQNRKTDSKIKNYLLLIARKEPTHGIKKGREYEKLNETHQLIYHICENPNLKSYTYKDAEEITHIKWLLTSLIFPKNITYRTFITTILNGFWTPYDEFQSIDLLEKHMKKMFTELKIDAVLFDATLTSSIARLGNSSKSFNKLLSFLNNKLNVALLIVAKKEDESLIKHKKLNVDNSFSFIIENIERA